jgi:hypothetical protein
MDWRPGCLVRNSDPGPCGGGRACQREREDAAPGGDGMRLHRGIATLASAQVLCFVLLSYFEPGFFLLHLYQSIIYIALLLLLFYSEERWAYMIGMLTPAAWLVMAYATGMLSGAARQVVQVLKFNPTNTVSLLAAVTALLAVLMITFCAYRWKREYSGLRKWRSTFLVSLGVVAVYYATLVIWFWRMIPQA